MGSDVIIDSVPFLQLAIMTFKRDLDLLDLTKLFPVCPIRSIGEPLQLWRSIAGGSDCQTISPWCLGGEVSPGNIINRIMIE